jgi:hypothetical protein
MNMNMDILEKNIYKKDNYDEELFDLKMYIKNFVYTNWNKINFKTKTEDIIIDLELENDEYINDEEIFYKGILYT